MLVSSGVPGELSQLLVHDFFFLLLSNFSRSFSFFSGFFVLFLRSNGLGFPMLSVFIVQKHWDGVVLRLGPGQVTGVRVMGSCMLWMKIDMYIVMFSRCCNHMNQSSHFDISSDGALSE